MSNEHERDASGSASGTPAVQALMRFYEAEVKTGVRVDFFLS
jgi:hypothetical protein